MKNDEILAQARKGVLQGINKYYKLCKYYEFSTMFCLKQLMEVPTRVTSTSSTIIDHILASFPNRVSRQGVIDDGLSDHQIIYYTRKSPESKEVCTTKSIAVC